jgi:hypothetical protein
MLRTVTLLSAIFLIISIFGCSSDKNKPNGSVKDAKLYCNCLNEAGTDEAKMKNCQKLLMEHADTYLENANKEEIKQYSEAISDCM